MRTKLAPLSGNHTLALAKVANSEATATACAKRTVRALLSRIASTAPQPQMGELFMFCEGTRSDVTISKLCSMLMRVYFCNIYNEMQSQINMI